MVCEMSGSKRGELKIRNWRHSWGERTLVMGIVNVTPDSFSGDGITDAQRAVEHAIEQSTKGADLVDLGAESTRPGHQSVDAEEELQRLLPVLEGLRKRSQCIVSVDTTKAKVLETAFDAGADILNSIWGLTDELLLVVRELALPVVLMHNKDEPRYAGNVVVEVCEHLARQADLAISAGIKPENIILDPGIGFGKTAEHNLLVLHSLDKLVELGFPTLLGTSRKSFIGKLTGRPASDRLHGTAASVALAIAAGIDIVRVHDVEAIVDVVAVADAIIRGTRPNGWMSE
jgi:dihydropteroate synthase